MNLTNVLAEHDVRNWVLTEEVEDDVVGVNNVTHSTFVGTKDEFNAYVAIQPVLSSQGLTPEFDKASADISGYNIGKDRVIVISPNAPGANSDPDGSIWIQYTP